MVLMETWLMIEMDPQAWGGISYSLDMKVDTSQLHGAVQSTGVSYPALSHVVSTSDGFHPLVANVFVQG